MVRLTLLHENARIRATFDESTSIRSFFDDVSSFFPTVCLENVVLRLENPGTTATSILELPTNESPTLASVGVQNNARVVVLTQPTQEETQENTPNRAEDPLESSLLRELAALKSFATVVGPSSLGSPTLADVLRHTVPRVHQACLNALRFHGRLELETLLSTLPQAF